VSRAQAGLDFPHQYVVALTDDLGPLTVTPEVVWPAPLAKVYFWPVRVIVYVRDVVQQLPFCFVDHVPAMSGAAAGFVT
jgi:hypothetical protein